VVRWSIATAAIGLLVSHFVTSLKLRSVSAENRLLKQELNRFPLEDAALLHLAALQSGERLMWKVRPADGKR
jgi:hypothetical protein